MLELTYVLAVASRGNEIGAAGPDFVGLSRGTITKSLVGGEAGGSAGGSAGGGGRGLTDGAERCALDADGTGAGSLKAKVSLQVCWKRTVERHTSSHLLAVATRLAPQVQIMSV